MSTHALHTVEESLLEAWSPAEWMDLHVVLAVSGGADSVALLRAMSAAKQRLGGAGKLLVAHLNHHLRGGASDDDVTWLAHLCGSFNLPLEIGHVDVARLAAEQGDGLEAAARLARYEFLTDCAERLGARAVATAHTYDDQVETVLQRILRGTGLAGATGMRASRRLSPSVSLHRPLLGIRRKEIIAYLQQLGQTFREDVTNLDRGFTRNRVRLSLLPMLREEFNTDVDAALVRLAHQCGEAQELIEQRAAVLLDECVSDESGAIVGRPGPPSGKCRALIFRTAPLSEQPPIIVREVLKQAWLAAGWPAQSMGFDHWQRIAELMLGAGLKETGGALKEAGLAAQPDSPQMLSFPGDVQASREEGQIVLRRSVLR